MPIIKSQYSGSPDQNISPFQALIISVVSRGIAVFSLLPITVVKARYEVILYLHFHDFMYYNNYRVEFTLIKVSHKL